MGRQKTIPAGDRGQPVHIQVARKQTTRGNKWVTTHKEVLKTPAAARLRSPRATHSPKRSAQMQTPVGAFYPAGCAPNNDPFSPMPAPQFIARKKKYTVGRR